MGKITAEAREYIIAHINDRPRAAVAKAAGVSMAQMYRLVRQYGGEMLYNLSTHNPKADGIIREMYPTMSAREISERTGLDRGLINEWAKKLGVRHTPETEQRLKTKYLRNLSEGHSNMDYAEARRKWRITRRMDELRVLEGKPQKTNFRFRKITVKAYRAKWYLMKRYNYFDVDGEPYVLGYDSETRRCRNEEHYTKRYGLRFESEEE